MTTNDKAAAMAKIRPVGGGRLVDGSPFRWIFGLWEWIMSKAKKHSSGGSFMSPTATDRAVIVGINKYVGSPLAGCVNDAEQAKSIVMSRYGAMNDTSTVRDALTARGFSADGIVTLTDGQATTQAIASVLEWLAQTPAGGRAYFHYSGHGAQTPSTDPSEPDGLSETICPIDWDWTPAHMLTDKQMVAIFSKMAAGVRFNWVSDSCHSGDLSRGMSKNPCTPRQMPLDPSVPLAAEVIRRRAKGAKRTSVRRIVAGGGLDVAFVSGCASGGTSADTSVNGRPCGALTHYFFDSLLRLPPETSFATVADEAKKALAHAGYEQVPEAHGPQVGAPFLSRMSAPKAGGANAG